MCFYIARVPNADVVGFEHACLEFLQHYNRLPLAIRSATVVVVLTTPQHPQDIARTALLSVTGILAKPLTEEKVVALLHEHFPTLD